MKCLQLALQEGDEQPRLVRPRLNNVLYGSA